MDCQDDRDQICERELTGSTNWIVRTTEKVFASLELLSLLECLKRALKICLENDHYQSIEECVIDGYAIGMFTISIMLSWLLPLHHFLPAFLLLNAIALLRIIGLLAVHVNRLIFDPYNMRRDGRNALRSHRRVIILAFFSIGEFVFWFAMLYRLWGRTDFIRALAFSFNMMTTFGPAPKLRICPILSLPQAAIGFFMTITVFANIIAYLPKRGSKDEREKEALLEKWREEKAPPYP
jgi:hypothetical protein